MTECLNAVGFVFDSVQTYIKKDKSCKYSKYYCQDCMYCGDGGCLKPCNKCTNNSQYKICIFKLKKENIVCSGLNISTSIDDAWKVFKENIIYQKNGNFVISLTDSSNKSHSFFANLIKAKPCDCCEAVLLYFKYNIISLLTPQEQQALVINNANTQQQTILYQNYPFLTLSANTESNITFNLKSDEYKTVRFFNSQYYTFTNSL